MPTYPLPTLAAQITPTGITAPTFADIFASLQATYRSIFGSDAYLEPDSQDGQWLAALASAINDTNAATIAAYLSFSPQTAQGAGLASRVKINGIKKQVPTNSTADITLVGQDGTLITDGQVGDGTNTWSLPSTVTIGPTGDVTVTATCNTAGAVTAAPNTIAKILTPTLGWQTATNAAAATVGAPVESDAALRRRQSTSVALPAQTAFEATVGAVAAVAGVVRLAPYENDTGAPDADGLPAHSIALVVDGGDALAIAEAIVSKKTPGAFTYGTTSELVVDAFGVPRTIRFFRPTVVPILARVTIHPLADYNSAVGDEVLAAVADYINASNIGQDQVVTRLFLPANLFGGANSTTFNLVSVEIKKTGGSFAATDIAIAFNEVASAQLTDMSLVIS